VLQEAVTQAAHWQHARTQGVAMSVNVSARQFLAAGFATHLAGLLRESATDPGLVILEVTESVLVRDEPRARVVLAELQAIGVQLALDDFAPGRSPVGQLSTLPIDVIKIDRRFIAGVSGQPADRDVVAAVIQLAHGLGMTVVGEGVETAAQQRELVQLKADAGQGFYFARPMPAVQLDALLQQRRQQPSLRLLPPVAGRSGPRAV
jgi:EAL domain-containing protein (putative c-di-GMP-specific phosphodiesterase class I)